MKKIIFYAIATLILSVFFATVDFQQVDVLVVSTFSIIFLQSIAGIAADKQAYSLNQFYWLFNAVFFAIAPYVQYYTDTFPWVGHINEGDILNTNLYIILANIIYSLVRSYFNVEKRRLKPEALLQRHAKSYWRIDNSKKYGKETFVLFVISIVVLIAVTGFTNLFLRANSWGNSGQYEVNSAIRLVIDKFMRGAVLFYLLLTILYFKSYKDKVGLIWLTGIMAAGIITNFPTGIARYMVGAFYIGLLINWKRTFKLNYVPILAAFFALCFIFPALGTTRSEEYDVNKSLAQAISPNINGYTGGNYDAYTMLSESFRYIEDHGTTWGGQLLGSVFFFVPRQIWPDKPTGSGDTIAKGQNYSFANVGCTFLAEGVINFGAFGGLFFVFLLSIVIYKYDAFYWMMLAQNLVNNYWMLMYPTTMGFLIFILRGDLLSSLSYFIGVIVGGIGVFYFNKERKQRKRLKSIR